jgi:hypothetical protein
MPLIFKKLGWVADFCPFCREFTAARLTEVLWAGDDLFSCFRRDHVRQECECLACGGKFGTHELKNFRPRRRRPKPGENIEALIAATQPAARTEYSWRLEAEEAVRDNPLSLTPEARWTLLVEPFRITKGHAEAMSRSGWLDWIALGEMATSWTVAIASWPWALGQRDEEWVYLSVALVILAFLDSVWSLFKAARRRVRRVFLPLLKMALDPLEPGIEEIEHYWPELKGHIFQKALRPTDFADDRLQAGLK